MASNPNSPYSATFPQENFYSMDTLQGSTPDLKGSSPYLMSDPLNPPSASVTSLPSSPFLKPEDRHDHFVGIPKESLYPENRPRRRRGIQKKPWFWVVVVFVVVAAGSLIVYFAVIRPKQKADEAASNDSRESTPQQPVVAAVQIGQDGSTVTKEDGSTFTYRNSFGGYCEFFIIIVMHARGEDRLARQAGGAARGVGMEH